MGRKTHNAFMNHINAMRNETDFHGIISDYELKWLETIYTVTSLNKFKVVIRYFMKRKKEEN